MTSGDAVLGIDGCLKRIMDIPGARSVTMVDGASGLAIAAAGRHDLVDQHEDAAGTTDVVRAVLGCPALASGPGGDDVCEIIVCGSSGYHLLYLVNGDFDGRIFVHVVCDEATGNLGLARYQLTTILTRFVEGDDER
ncbi:MULTISPECIES: hypothetical protein [Nocardia]|uniref:Roadblock/LAMTOR2 domain-containing protein n=2 Tax=Nocardia farcinica TaxID=37329 RepID=A0A0H5P570_NOCFR|nr:MULTISPECIES: hypothetical protein [Nocardia]SLH92881.1 Uncharacterised protein [Mycobacteroides abscessus subsp. abscessus]MCZ9327498.1 hypothetical protein [Nocardia farcinica]PFX01034.1 hypothetical protein CJ469_03845 [Nocardia farcinica]PFX04548.1 hypothetical protein CJ468_05404 [Nocardia farcinica]UEX22053.1 hypothetical protein LMJ57_24250 [Nocardia farcinica]